MIVDGHDERSDEEPFKIFFAFEINSKAIVETNAHRYEATW